MAIPSHFHRGQRWISESEPELGLGSVLEVRARTVIVVFPASGEKREYVRDNAPLKRVRFREGDKVKNRDESVMAIESVIERDRLFFYRASGREFCETELSDAISFNNPEDRLLAGQIDPTEVFDLRIAALKQQHRCRKSAVRGFVGGRIDLIPHQLYIVSEVASRMVPRVLLADEVGLGKTIEACLILHRLILTGRVKRALIVVPEPLIHQWFVELLRRFNLWFHIFDEERCEAIEGANPEANPFLDDQLVLCGIDLFTTNERRVRDALSAGWDILIVDEAHHLGWSPESVSAEYAAVEALGRQTPGLLLLTATPEQLGIASHFARLRLLDPDRFYSLEEFMAEEARYRDVARLVDKILDNTPFNSREVEILAGILKKTETQLTLDLNQLARGEESARQNLLRALLDRHGTGRVMFRNTRVTVSGFPKRISRMHELEVADDSKVFDALAEEFASDTASKATGFEPNFLRDPRVVWLADLLRTLAPAKVLLICRTQRKVLALDVALRQHINVKMAVFHEGLPLVQRDRNAAWFAEEDGARLLICSEIGSEGRNFQFAHHLVLFDLPLDPELLEQRIGRLDRIGQTSEIQVHIPYVRGSSQEVLTRWYHEGLNSFEINLAGGRELLEQFRSEVHDLAQDFHETKKTTAAQLDLLIRQTRSARKDIAHRLERGRDRLLELNSFNSEAASSVLKQIRNSDKDAELDGFMIGVFDHYSIHVEELAPRTYQLGSAGVFADSFPGLPAEGLTVTGDRQRSLSREDVQFLTWDHPLVGGALDLLLGSEKGNSSFARWPDAKVRALYLETVYVLECIAPSVLHIDRFLPPTPARVMVDHSGKDVGSSLPAEMVATNLKNADAYTLMDQREVREELLPMLLEKCHALALSRIPAVIAEAQRTMGTQLDHEIVRLTELQKVNPSVRVQEIELLIEQKKELGKHLNAAHLRLDAVRLIQRGP